jgi:hypothetical protein
MKSKLKQAKFGLPFASRRRLPASKHRPIRAQITKQSLLHRVHDFFKTNPGAVLFGGFLSFIATVVTIATLLGILQDLRDRRDERVERAWNHLMTRMGGESDKGRSLNILLSNGEATAEIDLSCEAVGEWDSTNKLCVRPTRFYGVKYSPNAGKRLPVPLERRLPYGGSWQMPPIFTDQIVKGSDFADIDPPEDWARNTKFYNTNFYGARIGWDFGESGLINISDLTSAIILLRDIYKLEGNNISGAIFINNLEMPKNLADLGTQNWFWADNPPSEITENMDQSPPPLSSREFVEKIKSNVRICDPRFRSPHLNYGIYDFLDWGQLAAESIPQLADNLRLPGVDAYRENGVTFIKGQPTDPKTCPEISFSEAISAYPNAYRRDIGLELKAMR